ncbi:MAG: ABC transporter ATP-binding protein [Lachnospiraceae bacterium]|nr:ABC transporter ATP-binding protein [Lachnospiraceae bacterium]
MISVDNLTKTFEGFTALDRLDLHVDKGSVYGLVGPNGAGKSTIIRHLTGIYRQDSGTVTIDGQEVYDNAYIKSRVAYIPDDLFFFLNADINDMMKYYKGIYPHFNEDRYKKLLSVLTSIDPKKTIRKMSKGMQKQAAFILAMSTMADVFVLDEPVDGLDPVMRRQIWSLLMQDVTERQVTVLVSSHNLRELEDICDTVGIMNKGRMLIEKSLYSLQEGISKIQLAFREDNMPNITENSIDDIKCLSITKSGSVYTLIAKCSDSEVREKLRKYDPLIMDFIPLNLEEIFIHELGGEHYGIKEIIL